MQLIQHFEKKGIKWYRQRILLVPQPGGILHSIRNAIS